MSRAAADGQLLDGRELPKRSPPLEGRVAKAPEGSLEGGEVVESPGLEAGGEGLEGGLSGFEVEALVGVDQGEAIDVEPEGCAGGGPWHQFEPHGHGGLPAVGPDPAGDMAIGPVAGPWRRRDLALAVEFEAAGGRPDVPNGSAGPIRPSRPDSIKGCLGDERRKVEDAGEVGQVVRFPAERPDEASWGYHKKKVARKFCSH